MCSDIININATEPALGHQYIFLDISFLIHQLQYLNKIILESYDPLTLLFAKDNILGVTSYLHFNIPQKVTVSSVFQ